MRGDRPQGTKLLVATIGLATVSYVGCGNSHPPGNLMTAPLEPTATSSAPEEMPHGNLMAPPDQQPEVPSASASTVETTTPVAMSTPTASASASVKPTATGPIKPPKDHPHGNLMAPPPPPPKK
jgi:hypothetical protein